MKKNILIINANPKTNSLCKSLSETYAETANKKHNVNVLHIHDLDFAIDLREGYDEVIPLEEDLKLFQQYLIWSQHVVIVSPVWWGSMPAKFNYWKGELQN